MIIFEYKLHERKTTLLMFPYLKLSFDKFILRYHKVTMLFIMNKLTIFNTLEPVLN